MWLVPELTASASTTLTQLLAASPSTATTSSPLCFDGGPLKFDTPGLYPVMVAAPWDAVLAAWIKDNTEVRVQRVCREALELGFVVQQPSGFCADLWWLEVSASCHYEVSDTLHQGVVAMGPLDRLTDAHSAASELLALYPGGKVMGWPARALVQWSFDDGEAFTLELQAEAAHATLTYASFDLKRAAKLLQSVFAILHGPDTRMEPRPAFHVGLHEVYGS